jgi:hypothetical protein
LPVIIIMTIATLKETAVARSIAVLAAVAMIIGLSVAPALRVRAAETSVESQIAALLAQIAALEAQLGTSAGSSSSSWTCPATPFSMNLMQGSTGAEVMALQKFLNSMTETQVAASGAGSAGMETMTFGPATKAAVMKFQGKYAADILTPVGLTVGTGYWGMSSRAKANALCAGGSSTDDDNEGGDEDNELSGGEASLEDFELEEGDDDEVEEGQSGEVAEFSFDVEDGDIMIERVDVTFDPASGNDEDDPWDVFDTLMLYAGDVLVAEADASDEDEWLDDDEPYVFRFSGLDVVVDEGETAEMTLVVDVQSSVDGADTGDATWTVYVDEDDIRGVDGEGIDQYIGDENETATFDIDEEGADDGLSLNSSSNDPDASTIKVDEDDESDPADIFIFDVEVDEDSSDLTVDTAEVSVTITNPTGGIASITMDDVIDEVTLEINGEAVDYDSVTTDFDAAIADGASDTAVFTFDFNDDLVLEGDEDDDTEYEAVLTVVFEPLTGAYDAGTTIMAEVTTNAGEWDVEGNDNVDVDGSVSGETHTLIAQGITAMADPDDHNKSLATPDGAANDYVTFEIDFTVEAFDTDIYIPKSTQAIAATAAQSTSTVTNGIVYSIENGQDGDAVSEGTPSATISSSADSNGANTRYIVREGETETFTLSVTVTPAAASTGNTYNAQLRAINFADSDAVSDTRYEVTPDEDFQSPSQFVSDDL